jgi:hypothetical protein
MLVGVIVVKVEEVEVASGVCVAGVHREGWRMKQQGMSKSQENYNNDISRILD